MRKSFIIFLTAIFLAFLSFTNYAAAIEIPPPTEYETFGELIDAIIDFLRVLALVVAPLVIVVAGYFFVTSAGDPAKVTQAKYMVIYALIGLLIILMAKDIIALIRYVLGER